MNAAELDRQYRKVGFWVLVGLVLVLAAVVLSPFVNSLMWAAILSVLSYPIYARLKERMSETIASLITLLSTLLFVAIPLALVGLMVVLQFRDTVSTFQAPGEGSRNAISVEVIAEQADKTIAPIMKNLNVDFSVADYVQENREELQTQVTGPATRFAANLVVSVVLLVVTFLTMFFMLRDGHKLLQPALELMPLPRERTLKLLQKVQGTIHAVFMGVILVALIQGTLATLAYAVVGIDAWLLWGAATTVLCAIPLLGSPIIYIPLSLVLISQGQLAAGIGLAAFGLIVISNVDNFLRPKYIGERVGLHYISIFFSLLGGVLAFGPVGLIVGPVLLTIALQLIEYAREMRQSALGEVQA